MRALITALIATLGLLTVVTVASADHAWSVYHWPSDNLNPTVVDRTTSSLYDVPAGVLEWVNLDTLIQPEMATNNKKGDIKVKESVISSTSYLGLAGVYLDADGHITRAEIVLNTSLIVELYDLDAREAVADHVLCQEIGHVLGLDHNRDGDDTGGWPDNTCMNDQGHLGEYTSPNSHDIEQLNFIYDHTDASDGGDGGPDCSKNQNAKKCRSGSGQWVIVHVFWAP